MKLIPAESEANTTENALTVENIIPIIDPINIDDIPNIPSIPLFKKIGINIGKNVKVSSHIPNVEPPIDITKNTKHNNKNSFPFVIRLSAAIPSFKAFISITIFIAPPITNKENDTSEDSIKP